jgi:hypothetical protein
MFRFRYCSAYTIFQNLSVSVFNISVSVSAIQLWILPCLPLLSPSISVSAVSVSASDVQLNVVWPVSISSVQFQILECLHSSSNHPVSFSAVNCSAHTVVLILQFNFYCSVSVPAMPIQIPSLLFSFTYCSAHKIVMNLSVSVSAVSVPVSDVQLQFFYPIPLLSSCSIPIGFSFCCFSFSVCCSVLYTALLTRLF